MKKNNKKEFRAIIVDLDETGMYTILIEHHKSFPWPHWCTIKSMSSDDKDYLCNCAQEILDALNMDV